MTEEESTNICTQVAQFLQTEICELHSQDLEGKLKEICIYKLCQAVGIKCAYNYKSVFMDFFGCMCGQAVADILGLKLKIAPDCLTLFRYEGINFVISSKEYLTTLPLEEAFYRMFDLVDDNNTLIRQIAKYYRTDLQ